MLSRFLHFPAAKHAAAAGAQTVRAASLMRNVQGLGKSPTLAINELSAALKSDGVDVIRFGFGQSPFPVPDVLVSALEAHASEKDYLAVEGLPQLREGIAAAMSLRTGGSYTGEDVLVGPGSKELLFALKVAVDAEVCVPAGSWVSYGPQALLTGRPFSVIPTQRADGWKLTPQVLDEFLSGAAKTANKTRVVILNSPSNPTGLAYTNSEYASLAPIFAEHGVIVLADEIYGNVHHTRAHASLASVYPQGTIISDGLSKWAGAGGWRLGHFTFPKELDWLRTAIAAIGSETFSAVSAPIQYAATAAYPSAPDADASHIPDSLYEYIEGSCAILKSVGAYVATEARAAGLATPDPDGGFYIFPSFNVAHGDDLAAAGIVDNTQLATKILKDTGVALLPGAPFNVPDDELALRLAFVDFDGAAALKTYADTGSLDPTVLAPRVVDGMDRLATWSANIKSL